MTHFDLVIPVAEMYNIKRDCEIVRKFALSGDPIISVALIPLACRFWFETLDYFIKKGGPIQLEQSSRYSIKTLEIRQNFLMFESSTCSTLYETWILYRIKNSLII